MRPKSARHSNDIHCCSNIALNGR